MATPVEEIKDRLSIVDVVGKVVALKKAGHNYKGLCPFHTEKTPSFIVFPEDGHYHCFGCGQSGDIFNFVMRTENLEFPEALRQLADQAGVPLLAAPLAAADDRTRERLLEINAAAGHYFHNHLLKAADAKPARDFLTRRGVREDTVGAWELGYSSASWDALTHYLTGKGYSVDDLLAAGLARRREEHARPAPAPAGGDAERRPAEPPAAPTADRVYDYFRGRLMFPIRDAKGRVTGFGARTLGDDQPKFLNSPQTLVFDKSASLYGIDQAREAIRAAGQAVLVEGYMDAAIAHQMGAKNVVATLGTAMTDRQLGLLKRLAKSLVLALDADAAGDEATLRGLTVARDVMDRKAVPIPTWRGLVQFEYRLDADLRILALPRGEDPDEVLLRSVDEWQQLVRDALPVVDFYFKVVTSRLDLKDPKGKSAAVEQLLPLIKEIDNQVAQAHYVSRLATLVQVDERLLAARLRGLRLPERGPAGATPAGRRAAAAPDDDAGEDAPAGPAAGRRAARPSVEDYCLSLLLRSPFLFREAESLSADDFVDASSRQIFRSLQASLSQGTAWDAEQFAASLDPALRDHLARLLALPELLPAPPDDDVENAVAVAALRVRLAAGKSRLGRLQFAQRDPEVAADAGRAGQLLAESEGLRQEIGKLQKALDERTLLGRKTAGGG